MKNNGKSICNLLITLSSRGNRDLSVVSLNEQSIYTQWFYALLIVFCSVSRFINFDSTLGL